jgi:hypothetical protein
MKRIASPLRLLALLCSLVALSSCGPWGAVQRDLYSDQCTAGAQRCEGGIPQECNRGGSGKSPSPFAEWHNLDLCAEGTTCQLDADKAVCL